MKNKLECKICKKFFINLGRHVYNTHKLTSQEYYDKFFNKHLCPICNKSTTFFGIRRGYQKYCSTHCANLATSVFIYNNPQKNTKIKAKTIQTLQQRYGVSNSFQIKDVKLKALNNNSTKNAIDKRKQTLQANIELFCKEYECVPLKDALKLNSNKGWIKFIQFIIYKKWRKFIKVEDLEFIKNYKPNKYISKGENFLKKFILKNICADIITNDRKLIYPYELDIYIPKYNIAIEYNGTYWHNIINLNNNKHYHLNKSIKCRQKGIRLIHIYEFEDLLIQCNLLKQLLIDGTDNYNKKDFNKNNLIETIPKPIVIYNKFNNKIYGAGKLY